MLLHVIIDDVVVAAIAAIEGKPDVNHGAESLLWHAQLDNGTFDAVRQHAKCEDNSAHREWTCNMS